MSTTKDSDDSKGEVDGFHPLWKPSKDDESHKSAVGVVETQYTCNAQCLGDDTTPIINNAPNLAARLQLSKPVNEKCPVCVNTEASMSNCDAHLDSVTCEDVTSSAKSYIYKGLGCGYRCTGPPPAPVVTPEVKAVVTKAVPPVVDKVSQSIVKKSGLSAFWYYVIAAVAMVVLIVLGISMRRGLKEGERFETPLEDR